MIWKRARQEHHEQWVHSEPAVNIDLFDIAAQYKARCCELSCHQFLYEVGVGSFAVREIRRIKNFERFGDIPCRTSARHGQQSLRIQLFKEVFILVESLCDQANLLVMKMT